MNKSLAVSVACIALYWPTFKHCVVINRSRHKNRIKGSGQAWLLYVKDKSRNMPTTWRWARGDAWLNWPLSTLWLTDELSQSTSAYKHASLDSIQKHVTALFGKQQWSALGLCLYFACLNGRAYVSPGEGSAVTVSPWSRLHIVLY